MLANYARAWRRLNVTVGRRRVERPDTLDGHMPKNPFVAHPWPRVRLCLLADFVSAGADALFDLLTCYRRPRALWGDLPTIKREAVSTLRRARRLAAVERDWPGSARLIVLLDHALTLARSAPLAPEGAIRRRWLRLESVAERIQAFHLRLTHEAAEVRAREILLVDPSFINATARQWSSRIGCSEGVVGTLPAWEEAVEKTGRQRSRSLSPRRMEPLTDKLLDTLIAEQERDDSSGGLAGMPRGPRRPVNRNPA